MAHISSRDLSYYLLAPFWRNQVASQANRAFVHSNPVQGLTVSVCSFCSHIIAAPDPAQLEMAEDVHLCAEKWLEEDDSADSSH